MEISGGIFINNFLTQNLQKRLKNQSKNYFLGFQGISSAPRSCPVLRAGTKIKSDNLFM
jgi:hypothetical protein